MIDDPHAPPLISVIIPTFNRAHCLRRAVDSALRQTHPRVEVLVIDDGSTDATRDLLQKSYGSDSRVRVVYQPNAGVSAARNRGIALAQGEFIAFLDSDDELYPWKLAVQLACLTFLPDAGMIWTDMDAIGPDGTVIEHKYLKTMYGAYRHFKQEELFDRNWRLEEVPGAPLEGTGNARLFAGDIFSPMILGNLVHTSTVLLTRDRLRRVKGFNEALEPSGEDYDFHLRTCREGPVAFLDAASIHYQIGMEDALTHPAYHIHIALNNLKTIRSVIHQDRAQINLPGRVIKSRLASSYFWIGQTYEHLGDFQKARPYLLMCLWYNPSHLGAWTLLVFSCLPGRLQAWVHRHFRAPRSGSK